MRQKAVADKTLRFNNLFHLLKADLLRASFYELKREAAPGVDGVTWQVYEQNLDVRLPELEHELQIGRYRATPAKRGYITKEDGRQRPLPVRSTGEVNSAYSERPSGSGFDGNSWKSSKS